MRKKIIELFIGLSFLITYVSITSPQGQATTYENQAVVTFYEEEEPKVPENTQPETGGQETLPQTGSSFSYLGIIGMVVILLVWWLKKMKKEK